MLCHWCIVCVPSMSVWKWITGENVQYLKVFYWVFNAYLRQKIKMGREKWMLFVLSQDKCLVCWKRMKILWSIWVYAYFKIVCKKIKKRKKWVHLKMVINFWKREPKKNVARLLAIYLYSNVCTRYPKHIMRVLALVHIVLVWTDGFNHIAFGVHHYFTLFSNALSQFIFHRCEWQRRRDHRFLHAHTRNVHQNAW